jgi:hypothetical protein
MKKARIPKKSAAGVRELRSEYRFNYRKAKPNRFAGQSGRDRVVVVLDPDVSKVFHTPDSVNEVLRALIRTMPSRQKRSEPKSRKKEVRP